MIALLAYVICHSDWLMKWIHVSGLVMVK